MAPLQDSTRRVAQLVERGALSDALELLQVSLADEPANARLLHLKGVALGGLNRHDEALACFERCVELYPQIATGWYHKGVAHAALRDRVAAIDAYRRARKLDPTDASTAFNLGLELFREGDVREALEHLDEAESLGHEKARAAADAIRRHGGI